MNIVFFVYIFIELYVIIIIDRGDIDMDNVDWFGLEGKIFIIGFVIIFIYFICLAIWAIRKGKRIKKDKPMIRFEWLDAFYYHYHGIDHVETRTFFIVRDINTSKLYAFVDVYHQFEVTSKTLLKGKGLRKDLKKAEYGEQGSLWIDKELKEFYKREDDSVRLDNYKLTYSKDKESGKWISVDKKIYNANEKYDISLLDEVTFVEGIGEFDFEKNND